jgi:hypothetical protein
MMQSPPVLIRCLVHVLYLGRVQTGGFPLSCLDAHNWEETSQSMRRCRTQTGGNLPFDAPQVKHLAGNPCSRTFRFAD